MFKREVSKPSFSSGLVLGLISQIVPDRGRT